MSPGQFSPSVPSRGGSVEEVRLEERFRAALAWTIAFTLVLAGVWTFVVGVDWAERRLHGVGDDRPVERVLYLAAGAWYLVLAPVLLLRPVTAAALATRGALGLVLVHGGLAVASAPVTASGAGLLLHASGWLVLWRVRRGARTGRRRPWRRARLAAGVLAVLALEAVVLLEIAVPSGPFVACAALVAGAASGVAWYPRPRRRPILRSARSVFKRRGAARLLAVRVAALALVVVGALAGWSAVRGGSAEAGPFDVRFRLWACAPALAGLLAGSAAVTRWMPRRRRRRHREPAPRPLVVTSADLGPAPPAPGSGPTPGP